MLHASRRDRARDAPEGTRTLAEQGGGNVVAGIHEESRRHGADMEGPLTHSLSLFLSSRSGHPHDEAREHADMNSTESFHEKPHDAKTRSFVFRSTLTLSELTSPLMSSS